MPALLELTVAATLVLGPAPGEAAGEVAGAADTDEAGATQSEDRNALGVRSQQGTRRGALEFGLGSLLTATAFGLIAYASVELVRAGERRQQCALDNGGDGIDPCIYDPPVLGYTAAGLGYGFSVPLFVGAGLLFTRGARILRDARRWDAAHGAQALRPHLYGGPWWTRESGGLTLSLRF